ncbi:MAG: hypothetical protein ACJASQ_002188 [Crocinitomicaceae bacterium]|jgi:hypothetical protein
MNILRSIYFLAVLFSCSALQAQHGGYMNNWYFGSNAAINFDNGSPTVMSNSAMDSFEGCSSISDNDGNLLFYTNGGGVNGNYIGGVWNKNHEMMPNGDLDSLIGCTSSTQSALIVQKSWHEYFLFTTGCSEVEHSLKYSIIDMNHNGGLGDVVVKGVSLISSQDTIISETIGGTKHANGHDSWVVTHGVSDNTFYVFEVTTNGIIGPTAYTIGNITFGIGEARFDMHGNQLAYGHQVFDFDNATGVISNPITLNTNGFNREFSPSGRYVYLTSLSGMDWGLWQYDLQAANVAASKIQIVSENAPYGGLLLGPDSKLYVNWGNNYLSVINDPDNPGLTCNYDANFVSLGNCASGNLPNFISSDVTLLKTDEISLPANERKLIQISDLMGRTCEFKYSVPLLYQYSDGSVERVFKLKD